MSADTKTPENIIEPEVVVDPMVSQLNSITELIESLAKTSKALTLEMKALTKDVNKLRISKTGNKKQKRVINPDVPRKLGALEKPIPISDELSEFLALNKGEMYSRQQITQSINKFVKDNDLQNPENRRYILLESEAGLKLKSLLRDPDQPLTFFNIQRYLKVHYPKAEEDSSLKKEGKTVNVEDVHSSVPVDETLKNNVVPDADVVEEGDVPAKKKVIRKVVKKVAPASA
jgi:chromatin remodeling complex protein RSC6